MPADFRQYVDLTPYDTDPTDIYLGAIRLARMTLPEFELRQGTVEDALFQAFSYMQMLGVSAINRLPDRLMEGISRILGITRDEGTRATVDVVVTLNDIPDADNPFTFAQSSAFTYGITYASGTVSYPFMTTKLETFSAAAVRVASTGNVAIANGLENGDTIDGVTLATGDRVLLKAQTAGAENGIYVVVASGAASRALDADDVSELPLFVSVTEGTVGENTGWNMTNTGTITLGTTALTYVTGTYPQKTVTLSSQGVGVHPTPTAGQVVELAAIAPQVETAVVANPTNFTGGKNPESDNAYLDRCVTHLQGLSSTAITANQMRSYVLLSHADVSRCKVYNLVKAADRDLDPFGSPPGITEYAGYLLVVVYGQTGLLTSTERSDIAISAANRTSAGLTVAIEDPYLIDLTVTAEVLVEKRRASADMDTDITLALRRSLSPTIWSGKAEAILNSEVTETIRGVDGVVYVSKVVIAPTGSSSIAATEWYGSGTSDGNALAAAGDPNVYFLKAGSFPDITSTNVTLTITVAS